MKAHIQTLLDSAIATLQQQGVLPGDLKVSIQVTDTKDKAHGDFASNLALALGKQAGMNPRELAAQLIAALPGSSQLDKTEIAGPGFINFFIHSDALTATLEAMLTDNNLGVTKAENPQTIVVDFSSPNLAKEMHVGHLRSTVIGDAVARTLEYLGHKTIRQNHVGDWGTQFGMLLAYMEERRAAGEEPRMVLSDLEAFYRAAKSRFDESEDFADRARKMVVALQSGDKECLQLWQQFIDISMSHCQAVYDHLGVNLTRDDVRAESAYNDDLPKIIAALKEKNLLTEDQGAQCVFLDEFKGRDDKPLPLIVQKKDGGYLYATTDLAAIRYRVQELNADRILYFVDARQGDHFKMVFAVAKKAGFAKLETRLEHMGFGTVNGKDGKPFKTREGTSVKLSGLLDEAEKRAYELVKEKNPDLPENELKEIGRVVGIASVKYADLSKNRNSDYIFDWDLMLSFDGNTAPYLLYAYTRIASIFQRGNIDAEKLDGEIILEKEQETDLANQLTKFSEVLNKVAERGQPHLLCSYLYDLAGQFSSFYENCPVLNAEDEDMKNSRLRLSSLTANILKQGLHLLGIETLERM
ncbi:MAG TPA: arginine--tRNA ligase [Chromatiales bacterium]|nr:arginine--tRNA ligase [Thiotrichales bacterium]HIP69341.1 arginine--tRNA ligase [Chromatiales bacterium]